jgi:hypothetical protein
VDVDDVIRLLREVFAEDTAEADEVAVERFREACRRVDADPAERRRIDALGRYRL